MDRKQFLPILEALIRCATENVTMLEFARDSNTVFEVMSKDSELFNIGVPPELNLLELAHGVIGRILEIPELSDR